MHLAILVYVHYLGGRGGIRTHGTVSGTTVFKTVSLNRSDTLPYCGKTRLYYTIVCLFVNHFTTEFPGYFGGT